MSLINATDLTFSFTDEDVLKSINFSVEPKDKIGLIGANGAGKTTLFKILTKEYSTFNGVLTLQKDTVLGYMEQHACNESKLTVLDELLTIFKSIYDIEDELNDIQIKIERHSSDFIELLERQQFLHVEYERIGGLTYKNRARSALLGMGFSEADFNVPVSVLSGGQKSKLSLCKLLLSNADILLLDEPTNHLDINSINWLENWLSEYSGTFIVISHDRYFLDKVTNKTFEIEHNKLYSSKGNYSTYIKLKEQRIENERRVYEAQTKEIKRIEGIIEQQKRFNQAHNYITIASKQKSIDRINNNLVEPDKELSSINFSFKAGILSGNDVLTLLNISKSFDNGPLFSNINYELKRGDRCFIIGSNGCGKSTLLRIILNKIRRDTGRIMLGTGVKIGYFDQSLAELSSDKMVIDEVWDSYLSMTETEIRKALALFLFRGDDVFKIMNKLSGGEKARVALLKLMLSDSNFLVLDEPTNHLDIRSKEALENALSTYDGTMLIVSHDRYFINKLATKVVLLEKNGLIDYEGNYDNYVNLTENPSQKAHKKPKLSNEYKDKKKFQSDIRKIKTRINRLESEIAELENQEETINQKLNSGEFSSDYEKITLLSSELDSIQNAISEKIELWEKTNLELEEMEISNG